MEGRKDKMDGHTLTWIDWRTKQWTSE